MTNLITSSLKQDEKETSGGEGETGQVYGGPEAQITNTKPNQKAQPPSKFMNRLD